ncbi:MAG TPA: hypothetical protein PK385_04780 [Spirochaetota bacterium]|nr:hypothetical protein [Spirochaetota bacterium]HOS33084.1 hypothetical protein [Spirochaetota bacterium]HOS55354.1 hypothetical protein [Spirochaetota bacterium]HPK62774.1 hypothetical protein [Spirochaetota bacterium]HQF77865.1 hypothetical protein [Spirochaetota bacterium]
MKNQLNFLSSRLGFNIALRHFKFVNKIIKKFENKENLADVINEAFEEKNVDQYQFSPILSALLIDKYKYYSKTFNLKNNYSKPLATISDEIKKWNMFDVVLSYYHPQLGQTLINPKNENSWKNIDKLKENEMVAIYIGYFKDEFDLNLAQKAAKAIINLMNGEKYGDVSAFMEKPKAVAITIEKEEKIQSVKVVEKSASAKSVIKEALAMQKPIEVRSPVKKKLSPQYGITVANELFHNGNVEAWKKIIASYENKYPDIKVLVFYDGEEIKDLNTLFKWGKVKHGTNIYISLLGAEFRDISKLRRYLSQGASNRFEDFLKGDPTKILSLF